MRTRILSLLLLAVPAVLTAQASTPTPPPGRPYLFVLDLPGTALDEVPSSVKALNGVMTVVDKGGQHMLKASSPSEFLVTLPQALPANFTVELDFIPTNCCAADNIMLEGTPTRNRGVASAELTWHPERLSAVGGSPDMYQAPMPADLAASTPGTLTHVVVEFQGTQIKLYTNGRRLYTLDKQFARGRVLRVGLGGGDDGLNALYLASFRIGLGPASPSVIAGGPAPGSNPPSNPPSQLKPSANPLPVVNSTGSQQTASQSSAMTGSLSPAVTPVVTLTEGPGGLVVVDWTPVVSPGTYAVQRWKIDDAQCCNNFSPTNLTNPPWQDTWSAGRIAGTYVYAVTLTTSNGTASGQAQIQLQALAVSAPLAPMTAPAPMTATSTPSGTPVVSAPIAVQSGTPVRTGSTPPPGSPAAAALAPTGPPPNSISITGTPSLAQLNWASISGLRGVTYKVDRWLESNPACCTGQSATLTFPGWRDEGLQWSGAYVFRITAFYPDGTWGQATQRYVRPDPVNPANFRSVLVSGGSVYLRWDAVPDAAWYELSGPGLSLATFQATGTSYNVHNLAPGTYTWRVGTFYSSPNAPAPVSGPASAFPSVTVTVP